MAKWGEGDPRWIVEERADATNVNNWHWTERDVTNWSSDKLKELLSGVRVESEEGSCGVTEVSKVEGEASINNRKGKLIFFYEWDVQATWKGVSNTGTKYKGSIEVPNLSDENNMEDLDIIVTVTKGDPEAPLPVLMKTEGAAKIRAALGSYVDYLKTEFTQGMILPTANGVSKQAQSQAQVKVDKTQIGFVSSAAASSAGVKIPTCKVSLKDTFLTSAEELYRVFINQELVQAFTHAAAVVDGEKGGKFRLLDGNILGEFQELVPEQKIVMKWRYNTWPCEHYATVTMNLLDRGNDTELAVELRGVPVNEEERTRHGWQQYYFEGIKQTFGYGSRLY
ncbi:activator of 90 kDa heat shock protein ATPase homolog 1a [Brienomyrus brachyistius]|uniref:activator of 90 kDa heat shock protein ATPase homolog 1a n=1 Tax=Brienomyrus brachyistius TaxID=42636 RepID=UPI0020B1E15D|nr:activator of 90 kDa heat shock protein ATPase homolog 1a [Brienomyrus brachyistius]